jgi:hypothetical protein
VQIVSSPLHEKVVKLDRRRLRRFLPLLFHKIVPDISHDNLPFILGKKTSNLPSGQYHIDILQEILLLDLRISQDETSLLAEMAGLLEILFDILPQIFLAVILRQHDLPGLHPANIRGQSSQRLLAGSTHADQQS